MGHENSVSGEGEAKTNAEGTCREGSAMRLTLMGKSPQVGQNARISQK